MADDKTGMQGRVEPLTLSLAEERVVRAVVLALRRLRHGSVQIVVQDCRVVQIDTLEKLRISHQEIE